MLQLSSRPISYQGFLFGTSRLNQVILCVDIMCARVCFHPGFQVVWCKMYMNRTPTPHPTPPPPIHTCVRGEGCGLRGSLIGAHLVGSSSWSSGHVCVPGGAPGVGAGVAGSLYTLERLGAVLSTWLYLRVGLQTAPLGLLTLEFTGRDGSEEMGVKGGRVTVCGEVLPLHRQLHGPQSMQTSDCGILPWMQATNR